MADDEAATLATARDPDVLILGAGAAGLHAAAMIAAAGLRAIVLEARERIGGRIFSTPNLQASAPVELGAEFVHGTPPTTLRLLERFAVPLVDASQQRWTLQNGQLEPSEDLFEQVKHGLGRARRRLARRDMSLEALLESLPARALSEDARQFARMLVCGFDAADPHEVSARSVIEEWSGESAADAPTFRPARGYGALIEQLLGDIARESRVVLRLEQRVETVHWGRGRVSVAGTSLTGDAFEHRARAAIVTLPLGVLQLPAGALGSIRFEPQLPAAKRHALDALRAGPVIKLVLHFERAFWETLDGGRYRDAAFLHAPGAPFPTFWTALPMRLPSIVAWTAGPQAQRLQSSTRSELAQLALRSLEALFGARVRPMLRSLLRGVQAHDWQADPYARGAYSYVRAGGANARRALAMPLARTLFFAGEAADASGQSGTVEGALCSGARAATEAIATLGARR